MARFEVLRADKEKTLTKVKIVKDGDGNKVARQYDETVNMTVNAYGHEDISVGDVLEITEPHLIAKARNNTEYFKEASDESKPARRRGPRKGASKGALGAS